MARLRLGGQTAAISALVFVACTTITEEMPKRPASNPVLPTQPIVVVPVPIPQGPVAPNPNPAPNPAPNPNPAPAPNPTANPNPAPDPPPSSQGCRLPKGSGSGNNCPRQAPSFLAAVESAMDQLAREEPQVFDLNATNGCGNCYRVRNVNRYVSRMPELMVQRGFCAMYDGEELAVKNTNAFNDQYDILTASGYIRRQLGSYRVTCYPAWF